MTHQKLFQMVGICQAEVVNVTAGLKLRIMRRPLTQQKRRLAVVETLVVKAAIQFVSTLIRVGTGHCLVD